MNLMIQGAARLISTTFLPVLCAAAMLGAGAFTATAAPRTASMVIDVHTGRVLHQKKARLPVYPASLTKLMTIYMVFEALEKKQIGWSTPITISRHAAAQSPSKLGLKPGETISVRDAVGALVVKSANDIAAAVAEHLAGSEHAFARRMTSRAHALGMTSTQFRNASGLPNPHQRTTAHDMIRLAVHLFDDFPQHFHLFRKRRFVYRGRTYRNHNGLLGRFAGTDGFKTGYTRASGFNLVASVHRNRRHVIGVVFGGRTARRRNRRMRYLLTAALKKATPGRSRLRRAPHRISRRPAKTRAAPPPKATIRRHPRGSTLDLRRRRLAGLAGRTTHRPQPKPEPLRVAPVRTVDIKTRPEPAPTTARRSAEADGRPPSTLGQQARALARHTGGQPQIQPQAPQPNSRWTGDAGRSGLGAATTMGAYHVQVGAYSSAVEARARLAHLRQRLGPLVYSARPSTESALVADRRVYRARFAGLDAETATRVCTEMRRRAIDCFVGR